MVFLRRRDVIRRVSEGEGLLPDAVEDREVLCGEVAVRVAVYRQKFEPVLGNDEEPWGGRSRLLRDRDHEVAHRLAR